MVKIEPKGHRMAWDDMGSVFVDTAMKIGLDVESLTYKPEGGLARSVPFHVKRGQADELGVGPGGHPVAVIATDNDATTGISTAEITPGRDRVVLKMRSGAEEQEHTIVRILTHDPEWIVLEVR